VDLNDIEQSAEENIWTYDKLTGRRGRLRTKICIFIKYISLRRRGRGGQGWG